MNCLCHNGTRYIRTTSGKCFHRSIISCSIESWDYCFFGMCQTLRQDLLCLICVKSTLFIKEDHFCCIDKFIAKISSHDHTIQILSSGCRIIASHLLAEILADHLKLLIQAQIQLKSVNDLLITGLDRI